MSFGKDESDNAEDGFGGGRSSESFTEDSEEFLKDAIAVRHGEGGGGGGGAAGHVGAAGVPPFMRERIVVICPSREGEAELIFSEATVMGILRLPIQMGRDLQVMRGTPFERCQREQRIS